MTTRNCEICSGTAFQPMHTQSFQLPGSRQTTAYTVAACQDCGFVCAINIPSQAEQDAYYAESARHIHASTVPAGLASIHQDFFGFVSTHLNLGTDAAILDVGSSMGHFLNLFKRAGLSDVTGVEPSTTASALAMETYGITVFPDSLGNFQPQREFDLITLCGVLEHLSGLHGTISQVSNLLSGRGHVFIAVPDAASFGDAMPHEPYLEFALEHINFFTAKSLDNLLVAHGFNRIAQVSQWNDFYANRYLLALYERGPASRWEPDATGRSSIERYVELSEMRMKTVRESIAALAASQAPLIVWGAGSLASRLCANTQLAECRLLAFVDTNDQLHGRALLGTTIHPPEWIHNHPEAAILIASYVYGQEIRERLEEEFKWASPIVTI